MKKKENWDGYCKEKNLLQLPLFYFQMSNKKEIEHIWTNDDGKECKVICYCPIGLPGSLEQDVYSACLRIWVKQGMPPVIETTYTEITKILGLSTSNWLTKVKKALLKLGMARYVFYNCFIVKDSILEITKPFSLFTSPEFTENTKRGRKKSKIKLNFPEEIRSNIEIRYYQWLNFELYKEIKSGLPRRLYEFLEKRRYQLQRTPISEKKLCNWLPIKDKRKGNRRKRLERIAQVLIEVGFLDSYTFDTEKEHCLFEYAKTKTPAPTEIRPLKAVTPPNVIPLDPQPVIETPQIPEVTEALTWLQSIPYLRKTTIAEITRQTNFLEIYPSIRAEYERQKESIERPAGWVKSAFREGYKHTKGKQEQKKEINDSRQKKIDQIKQAIQKNGGRGVAKYDQEPIRDIVDAGLFMGSSVIPWEHIDLKKII